MGRVVVDDAVLNVFLTKKIPGALGKESWATTDYPNDTESAILLWRRACELYPEKMTQAQKDRFESDRQMPFEIEFLYQSPMPARFLCQELYRILIEEDTNEAD